MLTARLRFREFRPGDWRVLHVYQNDPRYLEHYPEHERTPEAVRELVDRFVRWQAETPRRGYQFALEQSDAEGLIGTAGLRIGPDDAQAASFGIELDPEFWGQGLAAEATEGLLAWGRETLGLRRIDAYCAASNQRVHRLLESHGFQRIEGTLPLDGEVLYRID